MRETINVYNQTKNPCKVFPAKCHFFPSTSSPRFFFFRVAKWSFKKKRVLDRHSGWQTSRRLSQGRKKGDRRSRRRGQKRGGERRRRLWLGPALPEEERPRQHELVAARVGMLADHAVAPLIWTWDADCACAVTLWLWIYMC